MSDPKSPSAEAPAEPVKRRYFLPQYDMTVEAESLSAATKIAEQKAKKEDK